MFTCSSVPFGVGRNATMKKLFLSMTSVMILTVTSASAFAAQPFDKAEFAAAQASGKSILVDVAAPWCPTCARQKPIIDSLERIEPQLTVFTVDFDSAKQTLKMFHVRYQSTLIVFKGRTEVGRSTGETDPDAVAALVRKGL